MPVFVVPFVLVLWQIVNICICHDRELQQTQSVTSKSPKNYSTIFFVDESIYNDLLCNSHLNQFREALALKQSLDRKLFFWHILLKKTTFLIFNSITLTSHFKIYKKICKICKKSDLKKRIAGVQRASQSS